ncbi:MAG: sporulation protein YabP [Tepidanaerobacteraceae bacterium]|nr:sporulation protein YabP [Tepidanaerobacter sp.]HQA60546.1 sporulation protein YabP [Tepidanaerobacteraceae bacterium]
MEEKGGHKITLTNRELLDVSGVLNVEKFTDEDVLLETDQGMLNIKGENMHMKQLNLDAGMIAIEGAFKALSYQEGLALGQKRKSLLRRLLK